MNIPRLRFSRRKFQSDQPEHLKNLQDLEDWANRVRLTNFLILEGPGKTNAADADFTFVPKNGLTVLVRDTTTGNIWLSGRANGNWQHVQLT